MDLKELFNIVDFYHQNKRYPQGLEDKKELFDLFYISLKGFLERYSEEAQTAAIQTLPPDLQSVFQLVADLLKQQLS